MANNLNELVLGGNGLIGAALGDVLRAKGHHVTSLDLRTGCDLRDVVIEPFQMCDRVWFLAWDTGGAKYIEDTEKQHQMYKHNCELSARVFDHLAQSNKPFMFVTSQLAGQPTAYGLTKLMGEHWAKQIGGKVARLWNVYGWEHPDVRSHVITDLVLSGVANGQVNCRTDGKERRRFVYKSDCVTGLIDLFEGQERTADIAGSEWLSIRQVAEEIARQLNVEVKFGSQRGSEVMIDPENCLSRWQPAVSFHDGIAKVINHAQLFVDQQKQL